MCHGLLQMRTATRGSVCCRKLPLHAASSPKYATCSKHKPAQHALSFNRRQQTCNKHTQACIETRHTQKLCAEAVNEPAHRPCRHCMVLQQVKPERTCSRGTAQIPRQNRDPNVQHISHGRLRLFATRNASLYDRCYLGGDRSVRRFTQLKPVDLQKLSGAAWQMLSVA